MSGARDSGLVAALPLAATAALLSARLLPLRFEYQENALGIVSLASLDRYPQQQETFWLFTSVGVGQELSTAMSLLGYIAGILASLLGDIAFVVRRSQAAQESAET